MKRLPLLLLLVSSIIFVPTAHAQYRAGAAYLKILPGARFQGMGSSLTGSIDELHAFYANPAATGFLREKQWAMTYTKWIADIYNISLNYGWQLRAPWSKHARLALGINYQGVKEFDSTRGRDEPAKASDMVIAASVGNPITAISRNLSVGGNFKFMRSDLFRVATNTFIFDFGLLYRTKRFNLNNSVLKHAIISAGLAYTQIGSPLIFRSYDTNLPKTLRAGIAVNLGTHNGLQLKLAADYKNVEDEIDRISLGTELSWGSRLALRGGYNFNDRMMSKVSFGLSVQLDDRGVTSTGALFGRNNAIRIDLAGLEKNELFAETYRGSFNHFAIGPERYDLIEPLPGDTIHARYMDLSWEASHDPDLYDNVKYILLIEQTSRFPVPYLKLEDVLAEVKANDTNLKSIVNRYRSSLYMVADSTFGNFKKGEKVTHTIDVPPAGDYFWTVIAYDEDYHIRVVRNEIWHFHVKLPDIAVTDITFDYSPWITKSDTQGVVNVFVTNGGKGAVNNVDVILLDYGILGEQDYRQATPIDTLIHTVIPQLRPNSTQEVRTMWKTTINGLHTFRAEATILSSVDWLLPEANLDNNKFQKSFYTIPKGLFTIPDTVNAFVLPKTSYDIPFVGRIFFNLNNAIVSREYYENQEWLYAPLDTLAARLDRNAGVNIRLQGFADRVSGETVELARQRVEAVRDVLRDLGVPDSKMLTSDMTWQIAADQKITNNQDALEERRYVNITAYQTNNPTENAVEIIRPVPFRTVNERPIPIPADFESTVKGVVPLTDGRLYVNSGELVDTVAVGYAVSSLDTVTWMHHVKYDLAWLSKDADYFIVLQDQRERTFLTRRRVVHLAPIPGDMPIVIGLAEFNNPQPYPILPWDELLRELNIRLTYQSNLRMRFTGHACGIQPVNINYYYSNLRAQTFQQYFLDGTEAERANDQVLYNLIDQRLDTEGTIGRGSDEPFNLMFEVDVFLQSCNRFYPVAYEKMSRLIAQGVTSGYLEPFEFEIRTGIIYLLGNNDTPFGRQVNRRIEIQFFEE